jgi:cytochrome b6-f complex iron-sulfur subunit
MNKGTDRRNAINKLLYGWAGITSLPIISAIVRFIVPPQKIFEGSLVVGAISDLTPGTGKIVQLGNRPVIVITTPESNHIAFRANCTHLGCIVQYRGDNNDIFCACHGSRFDLSGIPVSGPASKPLQEIPITIENNQLSISTT